MPRSRALAVALLSLLACDPAKRGVAGATCRASSDCADDLQCVRATCVDLATTATAPAPPSTQSPATSPAAPAIPSEPPPSAARPDSPTPAAPERIAAAQPAGAPPAAPPGESGSASPRGIPWVKPTAEGASAPPRDSGLGNLPPPPAGEPTSPRPSSPAPADRPANTTPPASAPAADASDPFASDEGWKAALADPLDPWARQLLKSLQGIKIGTFGAEGRSTSYKFRLSVCPDGKLEVQTRQGTGDATLDARLASALQSLTLSLSKPTLARLGGRCRRLAHEFTMKSQPGGTFRLI